MTQLRRSVRAALGSRKANVSHCAIVFQMLMLELLRVWAVLEIDGNGRFIIF